MANSCTCSLVRFFIRFRQAKCDAAQGHKNRMNSASGGARFPGLRLHMSLPTKDALVAGSQRLAMHGHTDFSPTLTK